MFSKIAITVYFVTLQIYLGNLYTKVFEVERLDRHNNTCSRPSYISSTQTSASWTCYPEIGENNWVAEDTQCIFECGQDRSVHHCIDGQWDNDPNEVGCCPELWTPYDSNILCVPRDIVYSDASNGSFCIFSCELDYGEWHQVGDLACVGNKWVAEPASILIEPSTLQCPPKSSTSTSTTEPPSTTTFITTTTSPPFLNVEKIWEFCYLGDGIGLTGVVVGDFNGNNKTQFLLGSGRASNGGSSSLSILEYNLVNNFDCVWNENLDIGATKIAKIVSNDTEYAAIGLYNGDIRMYEMYSMTLKFTLDGAVNGFMIKNILTVDANNDGKMELLVLGVEDNYSDPETMLSIFCLSTFKQISSIKLGDDYVDITTGYFTQNSMTELVYTDGSVFRFSADLKSLIFVDSFNTKLGAYITTLDVNDDGIDEIIGAGSSVRAYSALDFSRIWIHEEDYMSVDALSLGDIHGTGEISVLYGDDQWGSIHSLNARTGSETWSVKNPEHGVTFITSGDFDYDGSVDIAWGAGYSSSGADYMFIYDVGSQQEKWKSDDLDGPFYGFDIHDSNKDGNLEIVLQSYKSDSSYSGGVTYSIDFESKKILWKNDEVSNSWEGMNDLLTGNFNRDNYSDVLTIGSYTYDGRVYALSGETGQNIYTVALEERLNVGVLTDLELDGTMELIVGDRKSTLSFIDAKSGLILQTIKNIGSPGEITHISTTVDYEGKVDKVFALSKNYGNNYGVWMINVNNGHVSKISTGIVVPESITSNTTNLLVGDENGFLYLLEDDCNFGNETTAFKICDSRVLHLSVDFKDKDKITYSCEDSFGLFGIEDEAVIVNQDTSIDVKKARGYLIDDDLYFLTGGDMVRLWAANDS